MCAYTSAAPPSAIGLLPVEALWAPLWGGSPGDFLSAAEQRLLDRISHPRRRREWFAVRVLAKYLLLSRAPFSPVARVVGVGHVRSIPARKYQELDVIPSPSGAPEVRCRGSLEVPALSLSHVSPWAVAALSWEGAIGTDCERVEPRRPAFLRRSFTDTERLWVERRASASGPGADWLYTLLWSCKEAVFKTGCVAGLRAIDIQLLPDWLPDGADVRFAAQQREMAALPWSVNGLEPYFAFTASPEWVLVTAHFPGRQVRVARIS